MPVTSQDYALLVRSLLSEQPNDYEGFAKLAAGYRLLHPLEQPKMAQGIALAIGQVVDPGVLADAIHLAYHLELFDLETREAVEAQQAYGIEDPAVLREIDNYFAYLSRPIAQSATVC
jgi:hypothetical protein